MDVPWQVFAVALGLCGFLILMIWNMKSAQIDNLSRQLAKYKADLENCVKEPNHLRDIDALSDHVSGAVMRVEKDLAKESSERKEGHKDLQNKYERLNSEQQAINIKLAQDGR
ncbi:hypothetical protein ACFVYJ_01465 [Pontibacter sp. JAM-7]|uniref:hypothetical protein n=1 Tax=Pontibacter sp. JAM-7 TaxID=3366581 RepID=UPI003AF820AE